MPQDELHDSFSIAMRPIHGTAKMVSFPAVVPQNKAEKEKFWVDILLRGLAGIRKRVTEIRINEDDSHGQHDVVIDLTDGHCIGVQVTELTHELHRKRSAMRDRYLEKLTKAFTSLRVHSENRVALTLHFDGYDESDLALHPPEKVALLCQKIIDGGLSIRIEPTPFGNISIQELVEGDFYVPNVGNVGINVNFDLLPRSRETYLSAINLIAEKKMNSKSPWLLIWSLSFWKDKHWLGDEVVEHMRSTFSGSSFRQVYFLESMDGDGLFQANLKSHVIK